MKNIQKNLKVEKLEKEKRNLLKNIEPFLNNTIRGTFQIWYQVCARKSCKCHQSKKYQHGPYLRISYFKGGRTHHIYIPSEKEKIAERCCKNYQKVWSGIEKISQINIKLLKIKNGKRK